MFVLQFGNHSLAKMEYTYPRRAQSTTRLLQWKDVATIDTEKLEDAIAEARSAIADWRAGGFQADRWRLEGRGRQARTCAELKEDGIELEEYS